MKTAREYLDEDLEAVGNEFSMGSSPNGFPESMPVVPPGMMPGYYPVDTRRIAPAMLGTTASDAVPFYKKPVVAFAAGAAVVGGAWFWFGFLRHKMKKGGKK